MRRGLSQMWSILRWGTPSRRLQSSPLLWIAQWYGYRGDHAHLATEEIGDNLRLSSRPRRAPAAQGAVPPEPRSSSTCCRVLECLVPEGPRVPRGPSVRTRAGPPRGRKHSSSILHLICFGACRLGAGVLDSDSSNKEARPWLQGYLAHKKTSPP